MTDFTPDILPAASPERAALRPLREQVHQARRQVGRSGENLIAYPYDWQQPAATEMAAYEGICGSGPRDFTYIGFPWATLIDALRRRSTRLRGLLAALDQIARASTHAQHCRTVSVAQHIDAMKFVDVFKACGITDLFWSHAVRGQDEISGLKIHPFPLYPAQAPVADNADAQDRPRRYLANFVGAYSPGLYISDVRQKIFEDAGTAPDLLIIKRHAWHFDRAVYREQMHGLSASADEAAAERARTEEYLNAIKQSWFTLCPTGSGPNSIRIYEALALGSIPVILTHDLAMAGDRALWEAACLFEEDSAEGYARAREAMRTMPEPEIRRRQTAIADLFAVVGPPGYAALIQDAMSESKGNVA